jgi:hypothetical protein
LKWLSLTNLRSHKFTRRKEEKLVEKCRVKRWVIKGEGNMVHVFKKTPIKTILSAHEGDEPP